MTNQTSAILRVQDALERATLVGDCNGRQGLSINRRRRRHPLCNRLFVAPSTTSLFFSSFAEPRAVLNLRFCGAAVLAWGLIVWFARDFREWQAVRNVLVASIIGLAAD